ncbi:MAG: ChaN family lipoprotein [Burkholderiales bacterium]|nr:ChaN family lipoprotein [Burkholderiales bacterium]
MTPTRRRLVHRGAAVAAVATLAAAALLGAAPTGAAGDRCVPAGAWVVPQAGGGERIDTAALVREIAKRRVVLLGESHDSAEHHRWQAATLAALHAQRPEMVIVLEMFPRRVQGALDRWVAGELTEAEFLRDSDWREVWRFDPALYMPIFHFARMHRVPMVAGNVERSLTREVSAKGFDAVSADRREGVTRPAPPTDAYLDFLLASFGQHDNGRGAAGKPPGRDDPAFRRFVESQQVWDRAIAQKIAEASRARPGALVVGILGAGHAMNGFGVPHQLRDLGVTDVAVLLPWDVGSDCARLKPGLADAVFGVAAPARAASERPRLGVWLEPAEGGVRIRQVEKGSIAESAGLRDGDVIVAIAGVAPKETADVAEAVQRQAPGTWLPLSVRREVQTLELVAKFPPAK